MRAPIVGQSGSRGSLQRQSPVIGAIVPPNAVQLEALFESALDWDDG